MKMARNVLEVTNLTKDYGSFRAVDAISFNVRHGMVMGLLGPNGAGKSTTIQMLTGVTLPSSGKISYFGMDFTTHQQECLQRLNYASAYNTLQGRLSILENLRVFAGLYGVENSEAVIAEWIDYFDIKRLAKTKVWDLSAGEKTRLNLVKAMLNEPELILMDEPTASLDPDIADKTLELIEKLRSERELSILFTSHNMNEVTRICDEVIFLDGGKIVSQDTPKNHIGTIGDVTLELRYGGGREAVERVLVARRLAAEWPEKGSVRLKVSNEAVGGTIAALVNAGVEITDTEVIKPTLEDVFLKIARREK
jgi:ABC-2 type transport system ATP-binding protein